MDYITNNGEITVTNFTGNDSNITILNKIDGLPVTTIGDSVFTSNYLTSIELPDSVTSIGEKSFTNNISEVEIPRGCNYENTAFDDVTIIQK